MTIGRKWLSWIAAALVLLALPLGAFAADIPQDDPDISQDTPEIPQDIPGSIELTVCRGEKPIPGGEMTCIRVGEVWEKDGNYTFRRLDGKALTNFQSPKVAASLVKYAKDSKLDKTVKAIDDDGKVTFSDLEIGLYLLVQETAAPGYSKLAPFLVGIPYVSEGKYQYDVTPLVKGELERQAETQPPTTKPPDSKLPQTGQLNWPVPALTVLGLLLFSAGWAMKFGKKKDGYEK